MANYTQANRPIAVTTPLGPDVLLLTGLRGEEGLSRLFRFELELIAEDPLKVAFDKLLGARVTVVLKLDDERERYFSGICSQVGEVGRDVSVHALPPGDGAAALAPDPAGPEPHLPAPERPRHPAQGAHAAST